MNYQIINKNLMIVSLDKNDFINKSIKDIFVKEKLNSGWVSGIGAVCNAEIGYYDINIKQYFKKKYLEEYELTSLNGNIAFVDSEYFVHTHVTLSDNEFNCFGGHLFDAQIAAAGEFKVDLISNLINRKFCKNIGLNLWCLDNEEN
tara:strand:+ start:4008 stop:4445 length:438 start_codon:yes stop_codon:yes gene_type:complete